MIGPILGSTVIEFAKALPTFLGLTISYAGTILDVAGGKEETSAEKVTKATGHILEAIGTALVFQSTTVLLASCALKLSSSILGDELPVLKQVDAYATLAIKVFIVALSILAPAYMVFPLLSLLNDKMVRQGLKSLRDKIAPSISDAAASIALKVANTVAVGAVGALIAVSTPTVWSMLIGGSLIALPIISLVRDVRAYYGPNPQAVAI